MERKKLIEVALPLEKINTESAREKSIRHGHPSSLHLWWARRPLVAARAIIWASLVNDPSSEPEKFPTEEEQNIERQRLFKILEELVKWENSNDEDVINKAKVEIFNSTNGDLPELFDPFAGGGAIPLEGQRLGLKVYAQDLNPVAVLIDKAMIEIPPRFANLPPVNSEDNKMPQAGWEYAKGLSKDVEYYGHWMKNEAYKRIGYFYPKVKLPREQGGGEALVVAWIWARTIKCPNPACGCEIPLIKSTTLSKKNKKHIDILLDGNKASYVVKPGEVGEIKETVNRGGAKCVFCNTPVNLQHIKEEGKKNRISEELIAVVAEGKRSKIYLSADEEQARIIDEIRPVDCQLGEIAYYPGYLNPPAYGYDKFEKLFTKRQLMLLTVLSDLISEGIKKAEKDSIAAGMKNDHVHLSDGGCGATAYGEAIGVYLAMIVDKMAEYHSSNCSWNNNVEAVRNAFGMPGMSMSWDFAEANPFSNSSGCLENMIKRACSIIKNFDGTVAGQAVQYDAQEDSGLRNVMVSTDPPYYSNFPYADFSDFFYCWLRRTLKSVYPNLFNTMQAPKTAELVADQYRLGGKEKAAAFFEDGMLSACRNIYLSTREDIPVTIYYAFKQNDSNAGEGSKEAVSTGWEKMLSAIITAGFSIVGTWPIRTEKSGRTRGNGANALASSIVIVCRKRPLDAPQTTKKKLIINLQKELQPALKKLQESNIAPVDLAQSAIGPGMAVFSKYSQVLEADGTPMTVRSALKVINEQIDFYFNEQVGGIDTASRFCVDLYTQYAYNDIKYGEAEVLANAKGTSIPMLASRGVLYAKAGNVHLLERKDLPKKVDVNETNIWLLTQQLTFTMEEGGIEACAKIVADMFGSNAENAKDLAYRLFTIAEKNKWAAEAYAYNALVVAWPDIQLRAAEMKAVKPEQLDLFKMGYLDE